LTVATAPPPPADVRPDASAHAEPAESFVPVRGEAAWPLPIPTLRCVGIVGAGAVLVALGALHPAIGWAGFALAALAIVAAVTEWWALPRAEDLVAVRVGRPSLPLGADAEVAVELQLRGPQRAGELRLRVVDDLHDDIARTSEPEPGTIASGAPARAVTRVRPTKRGRFHLGSVHARLGGRAGLAERAIRFDAEQEVRVVPGLSEMAEAAKVLRRAAQREAGLRRTRLRGQGTAFESLREYVRGDDPRHVDWKSTARHAKLICRQYEVERSQSVMFMIDAGRWMTSEVDGLTRLDRVLNAALLLAHVASRRDDRVGVLVFSDTVHRFVPPGKGRAAVDRLLEAVFDVEPRLVESDYRGAFAHLAARHRKRSLLVLFTDVLSRDQSKLVMDECMRAAGRHLPLAVTLRDVGLDDLAERVPENASAAYRQAAAEELLLEREQALATMRRSGVHVLDVPPKLLAPSIVDRYLELKARMLL
jgi:uncharacterized protein (DUF58 family)